MALRNAEYQIGLTNLNECRVVDVVLEFVEHEELACSCDECILDIAALALNRTEPRYIVNEQHPAVKEGGDKPPKEELEKLVRAAADLVAKRPHCADR